MGKKLIRFIDYWTGKPFIWGQTDCTMITLKCLDYINDWELAPQFEAIYNTEVEATDFSINTMSMRQLLCDVGFTDVVRGFENDGDVVLSERSHGVYNSHINLGDKLFSSHPDYGIRLFPKRAMIKNYEVLRCLPA